MSATDRRGAVLAWLDVAGIIGLPDLTLELGPMTALVGPRGAGKSQLLSAIAWLLGAAARPPERSDGSVHVRARLTDGRSLEAPARPVPQPVGAPARTDGTRTSSPGATGYPACTYLRARSRFGPQEVNSSGEVARRLGALTDRPSSDAKAAESLVDAVEQTCAECDGGEVLLIEEPELLLTPQAQRYLYRLLRRFAEGGNQVLYSTRSPSFVDAAHHEEIVRLDRLGANRWIRRTDPAALTDADRVRLAAEFDHERSEMFFAEVVVLVEGQTERLSMPFIFRAMGHDPDAEGIAIVEVGGKANLPMAATLLEQLAIPFVVVHDADRGPESAALDARIRAASANAPIIRLVPDFEAAAGIPSHDDKPLHAWERFARSGPHRVPDPLARVVHEAEALLAQRVTARTGGR
jgi:predicted ATPase